MSIAVAVGVPFARLIGGAIVASGSLVADNVLSGQITRRAQSVTATQASVTANTASFTALHALAISTSGGSVLAIANGACAPGSYDGTLWFRARLLRTIESNTADAFHGPAFQTLNTAFQIGYVVSAASLAAVAFHRTAVWPTAFQTAHVAVLDVSSIAFPDEAVVGTAVAVNYFQRAMDATAAGVNTYTSEFGAVWSGTTLTRNPIMVDRGLHLVEMIR